MSADPKYTPTDWRALVGRRALLASPPWSGELHEGTIVEELAAFLRDGLIGRGEP